MTKTEQALHYFTNGFNCAQAVFVPFAREAGFTEDQALRVSCAFGGGMGRQQHTCGAVTGALMALGVRFGKGKNDPDDRKLDTYARTRSLFDSFMEAHSSVGCRELLEGLNMNDAADREKITALRLHETRCQSCITTAIGFLEQQTETPQ